MRLRLADDDRRRPGGGRDRGDDTPGTGLHPGFVGKGGIGIGGDVAGAGPHRIAGAVQLRIGEVEVETHHHRVDMCVGLIEGRPEAGASEQCLR